MSGSARIGLLLPAVLLATVPRSAGAAPQQPSAQLAHGQRVYADHCAACHGANGNPGSISLAIKYRGAVPALLADRTDLSEDVTISVVRGGIANMPFYRKTEISDADLSDLAAYLARNVPKEKK